MVDIQSATAEIRRVKKKERRKRERKKERKKKEKYNVRICCARRPRHNKPETEPRISKYARIN